MGATRAAIISELLCESLLIAAVGGALGILVGYGALKGLLVLNPGGFDVFGPIVLDGRVIAVMLFVSVATSVVFGLVPAFEASKVDLRSALAEGGRTGTGRRGLWIPPPLATTPPSCFLFLKPRLASLADTTALHSLSGGPN